MRVIRVVGIDPSMRNWGMVCADVNIDSGKLLVRDLKLVKTEAENKKKKIRVTSDDLRRAKELTNEFHGFIRRTEPQIVISEISTGGGDEGRGTRLITSFGICTGILAGCPLPLIEVSPKEVKMAGAGHKTATKAEMIEWATALHPEANWLKYKRNGKLLVTDANEHLADALAVIYAGVDTEQFQMAAAMFRRMVGNG